MAISLRGIKTRYELKEVIERGGMGVVYKAHDKVMKRAVALKTILDLTDSKAIQLFQRECEDLASLSHPNIIEIFDVGQLQGENGIQPYLVMPLLPGATLEKLISTPTSHLSVERCVDIFCQTCRGLHAAHERGLIHRDLKPSNIFIMEDDSVKIIDFGVAHRYIGDQTIGRKGTLLYMSPEQIAMLPLTPASDIFSLGVVCYETLTRRRPFEGSSERDVESAILHEVPPPVHEVNASIPLTLSQAIHKATAKNAIHRYRSAKEFGEVLQRALRNEPIELFNPVRIQSRLQRAQSAYEKGDYQYAGEIIDELESEGHLDPVIKQLKRSIEKARIERRVKQLIETARSRMDEEEYQIALQKINEALELDPKNTEALSLQAKVDARRTSKDIEGWFELARTHMSNSAFAPAREALCRILHLRPREPRAVQLLSEVERSEQNYQRIRQEKEALYHAAVEADRQGDISSALSKVEQVLEMEKRAPEPSRAATYQRLYDKVRNDSDSIKNARTEAKRLLDDQKFAQALAICSEYLKKYPGDMLFQALKYDAEERQRQAISARIAETDRAVEAEPDLECRVKILERAVRESPDISHFEGALQNARDKRDMVNGIVARARACEERNQFNEARAQWEILSTIYPRYPGLSIEIERLNKRREQAQRQEAKARWVESIDQHLEAGEFERAADLARMAEDELPNDPEIAELRKVAQQGLERHRQAQQLLENGQAACERGNYDEGIEALRRSHELDDGNDKIRHALIETLVEQGRRLMDEDPERSRSLFDQALELEPNHALASGLLKLLADQQKRQDIDHALAQARKWQAEGDLEQSSIVIGEALRSHPGEQSLIHIENSLRKAMQERRRRDFEQAKRIAYDVDTADKLDEEKRVRYTDHLNRYLTRYGNDEEFQTVVHSARRRLETVFELIPSMYTEQEPRNQEVHAGENTADSIATEPAFEEHPEEPPDSVLSTPPSDDRNAGKHIGVANWIKKAFSQDRNRLITLAGVALALVTLITAVVLTRTKRPNATAPTVSSTGSVEITVTPQDSTVWVDGKQVSDTRPRITFERKAGKYEIEARHPGYETQRRQVEIETGRVVPVAFTLTPVNPVFRVFGSGRITLDSEAPADITDGQFSHVLTPGEHSVKIAMSRASETSFKIQVVPDGLPVVSGLSAKELNPLLVSNFGTAARIYGANTTPIPVYLFGKSIGNLDGNGLDLPALAPNVYSLALGEGKEAKTRQIEIGPQRSITALLEADLNVGTLLVEANGDDATVTLFFKDKEYAHKQTRNGQARFGSVRVRSYIVRMVKDGYEAIPNQQEVEVAKGEERKINFELRRKPSTTIVRVNSIAGADVYLDGVLITKAAADGTATIPNVGFGSHKVEARHQGYRSRVTEITASAGQDSTLDLKLSRGLGTVLISTNVPGAIVTYRGSHETAFLPVNGTTLQLPEGSYVFTASAPRYIAAETMITVTADAEFKVSLPLSPIPEPKPASIEAIWGKKFVQPSPGDWYLHKGESFIGVPKSGLAVIQFTAPLTRGRVFGKDKLIWVTNYRDGTSYLQYELDDKELKISRVKGGMRKQIASSPVKRAGVYTMRLECRTDAITVTINGAPAGKVMPETASEFREGSFGFLGNRETRLSDFRYIEGR